ncbi:MAG: BatD family protein [Helicobacteraceae bacterium]
MNLTGKTLLFLCLALGLFGAASVKFESSQIRLGQAGALVLEGDFVEPVSIAGLEITGRSSNSYTSIINGKVSSRNLLRLEFYPQGDLELNAKDFGGVNEKLRLRVLKDPHSDISFTIKTPAKTLTQGQSAALDFLITIPPNAPFAGGSLHFRASKSMSESSDLEFFGVGNGELKFTKRVLPSGAQEWSARAFIKAHKSGRVAIEPFGLGASYLDGERVFFSNRLALTVDPLPAGVSLVGHYKVQASVDSARVEAGKALTYTFRIYGEGDLEHFNLEMPPVPKASVFDDKPLFERDAGSAVGWQGAGSVAVSQKTFKKIFVANESFTIPPVSVKFFDGKRVVEIKSDEFKIEVTGGARADNFADFSRGGVGGDPSASAGANLGRAQSGQNGQDLKAEQDLGGAQDLSAVRDLSSRQDLRQAKDPSGLRAFWLGLALGAIFGVLGVAGALGARKILAARRGGGYHAGRLFKSKKDYLQEFLKFGARADLRPVICALEDEIYQGKPPKYSLRALAAIRKKLQIKDSKIPAKDTL